MMARRTQAVASVTNAPTSPSDDLAMRTRRYLWTMGIRTVCFIGAIVTPGWPRWVLVAGAVLLPYLGVVGANAGRERVATTTLEPVTPDFAVRALPASPPARQSADPGQPTGHPTGSP